MNRNIIIHCMCILAYLIMDVLAQILYRFYLSLLFHLSSIKLLPLAQIELRFYIQK